MNNLYGTGLGLKKKYKSISTKINEKREKIPIYLFFIKPRWIIMIFGILLTIYNYSIVANRTVDYNDEEAISKFNKEQIFTFPVLTAQFKIDDNNEIEDKEFFDFISKMNIEFANVNIFASHYLTSLSSLI